jgi:hypothetical protein
MPSCSISFIHRRGIAAFELVEQYFVDQNENNDKINNPHLAR